MPPFLYEQLKQAADMTMTTPSALARILIKQELSRWDLPGDQDEISQETSPETAPETPPSSPGRRSPNAKRRKKKNRR